MHRSKELIVGEISVIPLRSAQSRKILESAGASSSATVTRQTHAACKHHNHKCGYEQNRPITVQTPELVIHDPLGMTQQAEQEQS